MIKLIAACTAKRWRGVDRNQVSRGPGVWRVTGRHARLSVVSCRQRGGEATFKGAQFVERTIAREPQCCASSPIAMRRSGRHRQRHRLWPHFACVPFRSDPTHAWAIAARLQAGRVVINRARHDPLAPFGGYNRSGVGREIRRISASKPSSRPIRSFHVRRSSLRLRSRTVRQYETVSKAQIAPFHHPLPRRSERTVFSERLEDDMKQLSTRRTARPPRWRQLPPATLRVAAIRFAYRQLGPSTGTPLVLLQHFSGNIDAGTPPS